MWGIFIWWDPTFSCYGCSAASFNFGVLTGEDEHTSFYTIILIQRTFLVRSLKVKNHGAGGGKMVDFGTSVITLGYVVFLALILRILI